MLDTLLRHHSFKKGFSSLLTTITLGVLAALTWIGPQAVPHDFQKFSSEYSFFSSSPNGTEGGLAVPASCASGAHGGADEYSACSSCNSCGQCNSGQSQCGGPCSASAPPEPNNSCAASTCVGQTCTNSCGQPVSGTNPGSWVGVSGSCVGYGLGCSGTVTALQNTCTGSYSNIDTSGCVPCCIPDNSCAASTCSGQTCTNNCGSSVAGTFAGSWNNISAPCSNYGLGSGTVYAQQNSCTGAYQNVDTSGCYFPPVCGNGVVEAGESCDQGGSNGACPSSCSSSCASNSCPICGNGVVQSGEQCDNGGSNGSCPATCSNSCTNNTCSSCGNGVCDGGETCFSCSTDCASVPQTGGSCTGPSNTCGMTNTGIYRCDGSCTALMPPDSLCPSVPVCGNNIVEAGEQCDTGAARGVCPATCSNSCTNNSCTGTNGVCGAADGGSYSSAPSSSLCSTGAASAVSNSGGLWRWTCLGSGGGSNDTCWAFIDTPPVCGDGIREGAEICDNGGANGSCPATCSSSCTSNGVCPGSINGACGVAHYTCTSGTSTSNVDGVTDWTWTCQGANGGSNASCSESKSAAPQCDLTHYTCTSGTSSGGFNGGTAWYWWCTKAGYADTFCSEPNISATGQVTAINPNPCNIPIGSSSCSSQISWTTTGALNPVLEIPGATPATASGANGTNIIFTIPYGTHTVTLRDIGLGAILDTDTVTAVCNTGSAWDGSKCEAAPIVNVLINGSNGPIAASLGDTLNITWAVVGADATTTCTASGLWSGNKSQYGGVETPAPTAFATGSYTLSCTKPPLVPVVDSVDVNLSCTPSCTNWSPCGPPCSGGNGEQSRTCTTATCVVSPQTQSCTTETCRDLNWKEVGQ